MKMLMIVYNSAIDEEVMDVINKYNIAGYTKWDRVYGKGIVGGTHLGTEIWPGENSALFIALQEEDADIVLVEVKKLRSRLSGLGIKAFMWQLEEVT